MQYLNYKRFSKPIKIIILILAIGVLCFMVITPLIPEIQFLLVQSQRQESQQSEQPQSQPQTPNNTTNSPPPHVVQKKESPEQQRSRGIEQNVDEFSITIPSIQLDTSTVHSSHDDDTLSKGIWHKKSTGNPFFGGNMVISAHRFMYLGNTDTFYHLPKIQPGEEIILQWGDQDLIYRVTDTFEVGPEDVWIMNHTKEHQLTLYTCTPMWTSDRRFVVQAEPVS